MRLSPLFVSFVFFVVPLVAEPPLSLGTRLEPFLDDYLIAETHNLTRVPGVPASAGPVLTFDRPWEGRYSAYVTVIQDGPLLRLYYRGAPAPDAPYVTCYAESDDGRTWRKPALGLHAWRDHADTNILLAGGLELSENFTPFLDTNPAAAPDARFKAGAGEHRRGLRALASPDGLHWRLLTPAPVFTAGEFDSQNVPFWSVAENCYVLYFRTWSEGPFKGRRTVARTTSPDFLHWTAPVRMVFDGAPDEELYTNVTQPYPRAPHLSLALPSRFVPGRQWLDPAEARALAVPDGREKDVSDVVLVTTRGGSRYQRTFPGAFLLPGPEPADWVGRSNMVALGLVTLPDGRLGFYRQHHYAAPTNHLELLTLRPDGFAALRADRTGTLLTKTFLAAGTALHLNYATSAAGSLTVEVLDPEGKPIADFPPGTLYGDRPDRAVTWPNEKSWSTLQARAIRLRLSLTDAQLFSLQQR